MLNINVKSFEKLSKEAKVLENQIRSLKDEVVMPYYFQKLQSITYYATQAGKEQIRSAVTVTGAARAARGEGQPGRIKTGQFIDGFTLDNGKKVGDTYEFRIGWLDAKPDWAAYQELGFRHRAGMFVTGADALGETKRYIDNEISKLK